MCCRRKAESKKSAEIENLTACASTTSFRSLRDTNTIKTEKAPENVKGTTQQSAENENPNVNKNAAFKAKTLEKLSIFCYHEIFSSFSFSLLIQELNLIFVSDRNLLEFWFKIWESWAQVLIELVTVLRSPLFDGEIELQGKTWCACWTEMSLILVLEKRKYS
jgi:hypothetical protein